METVHVRYIVEDVDEALAFYVDRLGFEVVLHPAPGFAMVARGALRLLLNTPDAGGAGSTSDAGEVPTPGGWARFQLRVDDLGARLDDLRAAGVRVRTSVTEGTGGRQAVVEDPSGNAIELLEPADR